MPFTYHFFPKVKKVKAPSAMGVLAFVFVNGIIAILRLADLGWANWLALFLPALGSLGLLLTAVLKGKGTWIDYVILIFGHCNCWFGFKS